MKNKNDSLEQMRGQVKKAIDARYKTVEEFCWENDLNKATISNFLNNKKDFQVSTLEKIAQGLGKKLTIKIE